MRILTISAIVLAGILAALTFSPFRTVSGSHDSGAVLQTPGEGGADYKSQPLRSVLAIQQDINCVLQRYGEPTVTVDGKWGPMTDAAYRNAYSLQQAEEVDRGHYER